MNHDAIVVREMMIIPYVQGKKTMPLWGNFNDLPGLVIEV
jgi:hypothetical protein